MVICYQLELRKQLADILTECSSCHEGLLFIYILYSEEYVCMNEAFQVFGRMVCKRILLILQF